MMTTQISSSPTQAASTPLLSSDLEDFAAASSSSDLDHVTGDIVVQSVRKTSTPVQLLTSHMPSADQSPVSHGILTQSFDIGHGYVSKSSPMVSASGSPTPPTPQSHCSAGSPLSQHGLSDVAASVSHLPPPYPMGMANIEHGLMSPGMSLSPVDQTKSSLPPPPKKPLTPYMRFSKSIWQKVKATNQASSVCEIGATIGRMWREMNDIEKQHYNADFANDKARYDGELQSYLKATGLQASDLAKPKGKKPSRSVASLLPTMQSRPPLTVSADGTALGYVDGLSVSDNGSASAGFQSAAVGNGVVPGGLPHFSQVWSGSGGQDAYGAEKLLAQMDTDGTLLAQAASDAGATLSMSEDVSQQVAAMYSASQNHQLLNAGAATSSAQQEAAAMNNWLWQQYAMANGEQFGATASGESLQQNGTNHSAAAGGMIIYQLNADGTQTAYTQPMPISNQTQAVSDILEPGEVRMPSNGQAPGVTDQQLYSSMPAVGYQFPGSSNGQWTVQDGSSAVATTVLGSAADTEKQLLRGALVDKVREIQRLTRELEQAYALIHQLKQHNEFLQRQWGQAADGTPTRT